MEETTRPRGLGDAVREEVELLARHVETLATVREHGPIGIIRLSSLMGVARHKVRYSLRILEQSGLVAPSTEGARVVEERAKSFLRTLRNELETVRTQAADVLSSLEAREGPGA